MENLLIIGGTGKVGSELVLQLAQKNIRAKALTHNGNKAKELEAIGMKTIDGDVHQIESIELALAGIEKLFLLTQPGLDEANTKCAIIDAAKRSGVSHIVMLSGAGADHRSPISQARTHAKADDYLKSSGIDFTILQPYFFMQNFLNQTATIQAQHAIYGNYGDGCIAMVDTGDIAAVAVACLTVSGHNNQTYIITGEEAISYTQVADIFSAVTGRKINYINIASEQLINGLTGLGYPEWLANDLAMLGENIAANQFAKITDVVQTIGNKKPKAFTHFLREHAQIFV